MEAAGGSAAGGGSGSGLKKLPRSQSPSQLFGVSPEITVDATDSQQVEAASPISSRPPASSSLNYEELIRLSGGGSQMAVDDDEADRGGGGGNRWPRQETLALLKIRSEMDSAFRDATLKGPLWDEVSRKLAELGYNRSAKKCKEKFENVQKYYKRTKEGRGGRQDGKTYKFFTQLEALHNANAATATATAAVAATITTSNVAPSSFNSAPTPMSVNFGISNPTPISSVKISPTTISSQTPIGGIFSPSDHFTVRPPPPVAAPMGVSFSSNTSSASTDDDDEMGSGFDVAGTSRKRRRATEEEEEEEEKGSGKSHKMMMEFFEGLMQEVMKKQEVMQQKFLEAIEKREEDRMIREETWKNQEMGRLNLEQQRMAQERTISASRDAAIIAFLQKFTGQTIQLPAVNNVNISVPLSVPMPAAAAAAAPAPAPVPVSVSVLVPSRPLSPVPHPPLQHTNQNQIQTQIQNQVIPYQEITQGGDIGGSNSEPNISSSRWPKPEVLALIKIRGGLESKYQETGPKGPLWEDISNAMQQMGYNRSSKRCKEKWENINKYFKKVKESNKKRREDSKTCPYFDELDALHRRKIILGGGSDGGGGGGGGSSFSDTTKIEQDHPSTVIITPQPQSQTTTLAEGLSANLFGEGTDQEPPATLTKPEDIVNELMELQDHLYRPGSNANVDQDDDGEDEEDYCSDDDDIPEEKRNNLDYKIEFQRRNVGNSNGVGSEFQSMAVVQ